MEEPTAENLFPPCFQELISRSYPVNETTRIVAGSAAQRKTSLRANALKTTARDVAASLDQAGIAWQKVSWYGDAFVIDGACERDVWSLPAYESGEVYLQSLSSMLPPLVLNPAPGLDILDMCAAPGGKTTQLAALGGPDTYITACEMSVPRAEKLEYNLRKQGAGNVVVMRQDARKLDDFFRFDRILVDAPCSGSGTLRARDPKAFRRFTPELVKKCTRQQAALLDKALALLKPGGTLVYSTCSVLPQENEQQLAAALKRARKRGSYEIAPLAESLPGLESLPTLPNSLPGTLTICPTELYEGFFVAKVCHAR